MPWLLNVAPSREIVLPVFPGDAGKRKDPMEIVRFIFWEAAKILGLVFLAMFAAKAVGALVTSNQT